MMNNNFTPVKRKQHIQIYARVGVEVELPLNTKAGDIEREGEKGYNDKGDLGADNTVFTQQEQLVLVPQKMIDAFVAQIQDYSDNNWVLGGNGNDWKLDETYKHIIAF